MANALTGDFEAVLQVANRQLAGLLGTLHQNGANPDNPLSLPHSETGRIGDPHRPRPGDQVDTSVFAEWITSYQRKGPPGLGIADLQAQLISSAPPGAAQRLTNEFAAWRDSWTVVEIPPLPSVRGLVKLQLSNLSIIFPEGSSTEVVVTAAVRARYYPDKDARDLPRPVHGMVTATFRVRKINTPSAPKLLIVPSTDDSKITFTAAPGSGLTASDQINLSAEVRRALRESMAPVPAALPKDFPFSDFKCVGSGSQAVLALPFQISNAPAPASGVQPLSQSFIAASGFAIATSDAYIRRLFDLDEIKRQISNVTFKITVSVGFYSGTATYHLRFTSGPTLNFVSGGIEIAGSIAVETSTWWAPNGWVNFKQLIGLHLDAPSQTVSPVRVGEPDVDQSWFIPHQRVVNAVKTQIDNAVANSTSSVRKVFSDGRTTLRTAVRNLDPAATVTLTGVEVNPHGVVVRGEIGSGPRHAPVVSIGETESSTAFTAFQSWIPGGHIDRFVWSWIDRKPYAWWGVEKTSPDEHQFIFPKPSGVSDLSQICLRIEGTQIAPAGQTHAVAGGSTCSIGQFEFALSFPSWWGPVTLPIWRPDVGVKTSLREAVSAHVSLNTDRTSGVLASRSALVHFADWKLAKPIDALCLALSQAKHASNPIIIVVLPANAFDQTRQELESRIPANIDPKISIHFTEDHEGGWSQAFGVEGTSSTFMMNTQRQFVWKHEGAVEPAQLAAALDQFLGSRHIPQFRPLQLLVRQGEMVPDLWLEADDKEQFSIKRQLGREIWVTFWQSWSAPCLAELSRLQRIYEAGKNAPFIVAIHGGQDENAPAEVRKKLGLTFSIVQDSQHRIARQYGVSCWPTTLALGADGRISQIQYGAFQDRKPARAADVPA